MIYKKVCHHYMQVKNCPLCTKNGTAMTDTEIFEAKFEEHMDSIMHASNNLTGTEAILSFGYLSHRELQDFGIVPRQ